MSSCMAHVQNHHCTIPLRIGAMHRGETKAKTKMSFVPGSPQYYDSLPPKLTLTPIGLGKGVAFSKG